MFNAAVALSTLAEELETLAAEAQTIRDPRTPEILAWLEAMLPLEERLAVMHALTSAFPLLKNDRAWLMRIDAAIGELQPTTERHAEIVVKAGKISGRLMRELKSG
jgi:hypothetical protein